MRNNDNVNSYTDLNEHSFLRPPHVLVRADDIEYREIITEADLYAAGVNRRVLYEDADGNKFYQEFVPYVHPSGAASLTIGSIAWYNSKRPPGWEDKEKPGFIPEVSAEDDQSEPG